MRRLGVVVAVLAVTIAACSSDSGDSSDTGSPPDTGLPDSPERCEEMGPRELDIIRAGIVDGVTVSWGFTVKSTDYPDVWIIAAGVEGESFTDAYGTWATRADPWPTNVVGIVSVDEIAKTVSTFGEQSDIIVTGATDGVTSANACAIARIEAGGSG